MARVRFAARDPGGANVLAAFLRDWRPPPPHQHDLWTLPKATPVFAGLGPTELSEDALPGLEALWRKRPAEVLVTGTSHYAPFEPRLWELARAGGAPSLAVLDSWVNLDVRFRDGRPDFVGAVDREQVGELTALGFPADRVVVTGHPFLAALAEKAPLPENGAAGPVRVLFVSEPIAEDHARGANRPFGFDQMDAFAVVHGAALACARAGIEVEVVVKFHPYEEPACFQRAMASLPAPPGLTERALPPGEAPAPWLEWAHLVCGIGSMLLLEAIAAGRPVVSVQPGLAREDTFIASRRGFVPLLTDADASAALARIIGSAEERRGLLARNRDFLGTVDRSRGQGLARWIEERL
jgi:hypothetical protein